MSAEGWAFVEGSHYAHYFRGHASLCHRFAFHGAPGDLVDSYPHAEECRLCLVRLDMAESREEDDNSRYR